MSEPRPLLRTRSWRKPGARRKALLVHGLESDSATMWRFGHHLAERGWEAVSVGLVGHGLSHEASDYGLSAIADDLLRVRPESGQWDVAIGHSLGGAAVALGAHSDASWCRALALVDPALHVSDDDLDDLLATHRLTIRHPPTVADVSSSHPDWSLEDVRLKVRAAGLVRHSAVDAILRVNRPWDVRLTLQSLKMPVHVISGDPRVFAMTSRGTLRALEQTNALFSWTEIDGAGHSPHRERPVQTLSILDQFLERCAAMGF